VSTNIKFRPLTAVCLVLAIAFAIVGVVYFTSTASALPSFLPGHQASSAHHHTKHGIAMIGLAVLAVIGAWFTTAPAAGSSQRG
jgi:amino acid permease